MVVAKPSNDELRDKIRELVPRVDLDAMGVKAFVKLLSKEFADEPNLKPRKDFIKEVLSEVINEHQQAAEAASESDSEVAASEQQSEEENSDDDDDDDEKVARTPKKKGAQAGKRRGGGGGGGLSQELEISDKLAAFLGQGNMMSRTAIVKQLWEYIREHNLQNPSNKREIILDKPMRTVFGCERFTMFTMNKYIGAHIHPFKPVDLTATPKKTSAQKRKIKASSTSPKKKRKSGTQPPYRLSEDMQAVVGTDILPRPQVVSKLWEYIKANNLQNPDDKREILCDDKLQRIMKKPKISMFKMNVCIGEHLLEKLDRSEYQHEAASDAEGSDSETSE